MNTSDLDIALCALSSHSLSGASSFNEKSDSSNGVSVFFACPMRKSFNFLSLSKSKLIYTFFFAIGSSSWRLSTRRHLGNGTRSFCNGEDCLDNLLVLALGVPQRLEMPLDPAVREEPVERSVDFLPDPAGRMSRRADRNRIPIQPLRYLEFFHDPAGDDCFPRTRVKLITAEKNSEPRVRDHVFPILGQECLPRHSARWFLREGTQRCTVPELALVVGVQFLHGPEDNYSADADTDSRDEIVPLADDPLPDVTGQFLDPLAAHG